MSTAPPDAERPGRLVENIVHFARALRRAGLKVGTAEIETAIAAVTLTGLASRTDVHAVLRAVMVTRASQLDVFDRVFALFWRDPEFLEKAIHQLSPLLRGEPASPAPPAAAQRRAAEALGEDLPDVPPRPQPVREEIEFDARLTVSLTERLQTRDFEQMSTEEQRDAEAAIRRLDLPLPRLASRRMRRAAAGMRPDLRATMRASLRRGGEWSQILRVKPRTKPSDLVVLCDISGSMSVYSRMILLFVHALHHAPERDWRAVHAFTFGTRLTNVTRALAKRDPDAALAAIGTAARDWQGGTRIGDALMRFNKDWSRRVAGSGATVLLVTDGLERGDASRLSVEAERLALSCRRLLWLNPLLRFDGFAPRAVGIRALIRHVDGLYACHSLDSVSDLGAALSGAGVLAEIRARAA